MVGALIAGSAGKNAIGDKAQCGLRTGLFVSVGLSCSPGRFFLTFDGEMQADPASALDREPDAQLDWSIPPRTA